MTGVPAYWMVPNSVDIVEPQVGYKIDYTSASAKKQQLDQTLTTGQAVANQLRTGTMRNTVTLKSTQEDIAALMKDLHATADRAALLQVLPDYCADFKDPVVLGN